MRSTLGPADNAILDEYLTNIRDVEQQLDRMDARAAAVPEGAVAPLGLPDNIDDHLTVTYDLMLLAFQADISRVFTFMVGARGQRPQLRAHRHPRAAPPGLAPRRHAGGHRQVRQADDVSRRRSWREFVEKLQATADGDGTLLDRSLIYFGSGMGNGNAHDRNNPPVLLMGGANGKLKGNRHIEVEKKEPTANLLLAIGDLAGAEVEKIGHSTGRLSL